MVETEVKDGVASVFLARPEKSNALNTPFLQEIRACFEKLKGDAQLRVVVLAGRGKAFCGGADVTELASLDAANGELLWHSRIGNISNAPQTYEASGRQYILVGVNDTLYAYAIY